jgi:hypothetical protein
VCVRARECVRLRLLLEQMIELAEKFCPTIRDVRTPL